MSERDDFLALLSGHLAAALPLRVVTRSLKDPASHADEDLAAGILTLVAFGEGGYPNLNGRLGMDGRGKAALIGHLKVGEKEEPLAVEQAEFALYEDVLNALRTGPGLLRCLDINDFRQSGQIEHPYGWIAIELEWGT